MRLVNYWWHSVKEQKHLIKFPIGMLTLFLLVQILTWKTSDWIVAPFTILAIIFFGVALPIWEKLNLKNKGRKEEQ